MLVHKDWQIDADPRIRTDNRRFGQRNLLPRVPGVVSYEDFLVLPARYPSACRSHKDEVIGCRSILGRRPCLAAVDGSEHLARAGIGGVVAISNISQPCCEPTKSGQLR